LGVALATAFAGLTALGAQIVIPIQPVPITLQTLFVLLAGASIGRGWGSLSQWMYVGLGVAGLPLFAGGASGLAILSGPTGGYLVAFLVAPWVIGTLCSEVGSDWLADVLVRGGQGRHLALGVTHLTLFYTDKSRTVVRGGRGSFLPGAVIKIAAAVSIHRSSQALVRHYRSRGWAIFCCDWNQDAPDELRRVFCQVSA
jgi:biotin transport system substrate-specific component